NGACSTSLILPSYRGWAPPTDDRRRCDGVSPLFSTRRRIPSCERFPSPELLHRMLDQGHRFVDLARPDLRGVLLPGERALDEVGPARSQRLLGPPRRRRQKDRSEEHTSELQSPYDLVCRL